MARILVNLSSLSLSRFVGMAAGTILSILAGRILGPESFGQYALVFVFIGYFGVLMDFGMSTTIVKGIAAGEYRPEQIIGPTLVLRGVLYLFSTIILTLIGVFWRREMLPAFCVGAGIMLAETMYTGFDAALRGSQEMVWLSITEVVFSVTRLGLGACVLLSGYGLVPFLGSILAATALKLILVALFFLRINRERWTANVINQIQSIVRNSYSIAGWQVLSILYLQMNVPLIAFAKGDTAAGQFRAGSSFVDMPLSFLSIVFSVFLPVFSSLYARTPEKLEGTVAQILKLSYSLLFPVYVCVAGVGPLLVLLIFGEKYGAASSLLPILFAGVLTSLTLGILALIYIVQGRQHIALRFTILMVIVKGSLLIIVGKFLSIEFICASIICADVLNIILHAVGLRHTVHFPRKIAFPPLVSLFTGLAAVALYLVIPADTLTIRLFVVGSCVILNLGFLHVIGVLNIFRLKGELNLL